MSKQLVVYYPDGTRLRRTVKTDLDNQLLTLIEPREQLEWIPVAGGHLVIDLEQFELEWNEKATRFAQRRGLFYDDYDIYGTAVFVPHPYTTEQA